MTEDYTEQRRGRERRTEVVDGDAAVGEASGGPAGEVDAVGRVVGARERDDAVVVAVVHQRVPEHEQRRHHRRCPCLLRRRRRQKRAHGKEQLPQAGRHRSAQALSLRTPVLSGLQV